MPQRPRIPAPSLATPARQLGPPLKAGWKLYDVIQTDPRQHRPVLIGPTGVFMLDSKRLVAQNNPIPNHPHAIVPGRNMVLGAPYVANPIARPGGLLTTEAIAPVRRAFRASCETAPRWLQNRLCRHGCRGGPVGALICQILLLRANRPGPRRSRLTNHQKCWPPVRH